MKKKKRTKDILIDGIWYSKEYRNWEAILDAKIETTNIWDNPPIDNDEVWIFTDDKGWIKAIFNKSQYIDLNNNIIIPYIRIVCKLKYRPYSIVNCSQVMLKEYFE